jgi:hypothetical protein
MKKIIIVLVLLIVAFSIVKAFTAKPTVDQTPENGNTPNSAENAPEGSLHNLPIPEGVSAAKASLAARLNIAESNILIMEALETDWPNACLGLEEKGTLCAQVITPGYNVLMQANGKEYRYRTNQAGTVVKAEN